MRGLAAAAMTTTVGTSALRLASFADRPPRSAPEEKGGAKDDCPRHDCLDELTVHRALQHDR
jgi:hypothetical protein